MGTRCPMGKTRRSFTREFKVQAVRMVGEAGRRLSEVARGLAVEPELLRRCGEALGQETKKEVSEAFPGKGHLQPEPEQARHSMLANARPRKEREILKKALAIFSGP